MISRISLFLVCCATVPAYATIGYRAGQLLGQHGHHLGQAAQRSYSGVTPAARAAAQTSTRMKTAQLGTESRVQSLSQQRSFSGQPIARVSENSSGTTPAGRNIRQEYLTKERPSMQAPGRSAQNWNSAEVSNKWFAQNELGAAAATGLGAAAVGYVGAQSKLRAARLKEAAKPADVKTKEYWNSLRIQGMNMPDWFTRQQFEESKKILPAGSSNQEILKHMRSREKLRQNIQIEREIKQMPASDQKTWRARFQVASTRAVKINRDAMPLDIWQEVQEKQEISPEVRKAMGK